MSDLNILEALAVISQALSMLNDRFVTVIDFLDKVIALSLVGLLQLTKLSHHIISVLLQILEYFSLNLAALVDFIHAPLDRFELIVTLVLQNLALSFQIRKPHVDLLEHVEFTVSLEDSLPQVLNLVVDFGVLLLDLIDAILVRDKSVNDWVDQLLDQVPSLRLNIEPEQLKRGVFSRETLKVRRNEATILKLLLPLIDL